MKVFQGVHQRRRYGLLDRADNVPCSQNFAKIHKIIDIPNLIDIQKNSYKRFLQLDTPVDARKNSGLEAVFRSVFPIGTSVHRLARVRLVLLGRRDRSGSCRCR